MNHAKILAEAIPALSDAVGVSEVPFLKTLNRNFNMDSKYRDPGKWPPSRLGGDPKKRGWLHGDFQGPALPYVFGLYNEWVELGEL